MRLRRFCPLLLLVVILVASAAAAETAALHNCSAFVGSDSKGVFVGSNKDGNDPTFRLWFLPAGEGKYGRFVFGAAGIAGGGMNEHGLVVDQLTMPSVEVAGNPEKPVYSGSWPIHALETCRTVEEALVQFATYSFPGTWQTKIFLADATGDAAIIEGNTILRKSGRFLVTTNFIQSQTPPEEIDCERFLTATRMLEDASTYDAALFAKIANAVHQEYPGGGGTALTTVFDLVARRITCYLYYDYVHPAAFSLEAELQKGAHSFDIVDLLPSNSSYNRWRAEKLDELRRRVAAVAGRAGTWSMDTGVVGTYELNPSSELVSVVPHYIKTFAIVVADGHLGGVWSPEGDTFELFPSGVDSYTSLSLAASTPEIAVRFSRDAAGVVTGGTLTLQGRATGFRRTFAEPTYLALDHFWTDIPSVAAAPSTAFPAWVGIALLLVGIAGLALALLL